MKRRTRPLPIRRVAVAGGAGYIGSHMVRALLAAGFEPLVFDNLSTGHRDAVPRGVPFVRGDLRRAADVNRFLRRRLDAVMHFGALSIVSESVADPLKYYENNVCAAVTLLGGMAAHGVRRIVFSSSAAVYGEPRSVPITEDHPTVPLNPYGHSKLAVEHLLADARRAHGLSFAALRYFNAAGADPLSLAGERHRPETHLVPNVLKAARLGKPVPVFGDDYPTKDGTCVRDYVHVEDLCRAHLAALRALEDGDSATVLNLGTGEGFTVREVIRAAEKVTGGKIAVRVMPRRAGDPAVLVASRRKAGTVLGWRPEKGLDEMIRDAWRWEEAGRTRRAPFSLAKQVLG